MTGEHTVDRTYWEPGPWDGEPDRKEWRHSSGLACLAVRANTTGAWCGYVGVPPGHPYHGKGYDEVEVEVHWGLTYANACRGPICHVPAPGESDDVWWLGFDCAHAGDLTPGSEFRLPERLRGRCGDVYRDEAFVTAEVNRLADQLAEVARLALAR